ncbi:uncharacterized protein [Elaeis guineensis]|uniref:uncharacterized protein n=1 Tax=Elaeis guineensis var. tenera TaxID=51953 RepID=UPI003C6DAEF0
MDEEDFEVEAMVMDVLKVNLVDKKEGNEGHVLLMAYNGSDAPQTVTWFLDLELQIICAKERSFFTGLNERHCCNITFGDLSQRSIEGKGKICFELKNGKQLCISDVYYVPNMKSNILSIGQLHEKGYDVQMKDLALSLHDKNNISTLI